MNAVAILLLFIVTLPIVWGTHIFLNLASHFILHIVFWEVKTNYCIHFFKYEGLFIQTSPIFCYWQFHSLCLPVWKVLLTLCKILATCLSLIPSNIYSTLALSSSYLFSGSYSNFSVHITHRELVKFRSLIPDLEDSVVKARDIQFW